MDWWGRFFENVARGLMSSGVFPMVWLDGGDDGDGKWKGTPDRFIVLNAQESQRRNQAQPGIDQRMVSIRQRRG